MAERLEWEMLARKKMEEKAKKALKYLRRGNVIDPRTAKWMQWWDIVMMLALLFTALVTPLEVAFLEGGTVRGFCGASHAARGAGGR